MIRVIFAVLLLLTMGGCAPTVFTHPTKNNQDFERDKYDCEKVAEQSAANWGAKGNPFIIADEIKRCLQLKHGWIRVKQ